MSKMNSGYHIYRLSSGEILPDRDCILIWRPVQDRDHPSLQVFSDDTSHPHFLALVTPEGQASMCYPRELIILVDHSGSMEGKKWSAANRAAGNLLKSLNPEDCFNLCLFESTSHWYSDKPVRATQSEIGTALRSLRQPASGGTELGVALEQALRQPRKEGEISRHIIIITDAEVTDEGRILQLVKTERTRENPRRCSILCIDSAPNAALAILISRYGRGIVRFLTASDDEEDIHAAFDDIVSVWNSPIAIDLSLTINRDQVVVPERMVTKGDDGYTSIDLGDLVPGKNVWIYGRCGDGPSDCMFAVTSPAGAIQAEADGKYPVVRSLYGANIVSLLDLLKTSSYSPEETGGELAVLGYENHPAIQGEAPVYHENLGKTVRDRIRDFLIKASLDYGIASSETAFIAVRKDADRVVEESVIVGNALPAGWSEYFVTSMNTRSIIKQPDGTLQMPKRRKARDMASGGALIDWYGGRSGGDITRVQRTEPKENQQPFRWRGDAYILPHKNNNDPGMSAITLFKGRPVLIKGEAVLFDSEAKDMHNVIPRNFRMKKIRVSSMESQPEYADLRLMLFIGNPVQQVIEIPLSELEAQGGEVPVSARRKYGAIVRVLLMNVSGKPDPILPEMTVIVEGEAL